MSILMYKQRHRSPKLPQDAEMQLSPYQIYRYPSRLIKERGYAPHGLFRKLSPAEEVNEFQTRQEVG